MTIDLDTAHVVTRLVVAATFVAAACVTALRGRFGYTIFYVLAAIETYAKYRYQLVAVAREFLLGANPTNSDKYAIQTSALLVAAVVGGLLLCFTLFRLRHRHAELALAAGTAGVLAVFAVETISYHFVDAFIYTVQGGVMRSGWLYVATGLIATAGATGVKPRMRVT